LDFYHFVIIFFYETKSLPNLSRDEEVKEGRIFIFFQATEVHSILIGPGFYWQMCATKSDW
jgi:hypothetical protein